MNDSELDRLLDTWEIPGPRASLRAGLRARFPRAERRKFGRPLQWILALAIASAALAVGMQQGGENAWDFGLLGALTRLYNNFMEGLEAQRATSIVTHIRRSEPRVYVDGQLAPPLEYGPAAVMIVHVPGEGVYRVMAFRRPLDGWVEAGHIRGKRIEFQAGGKQVRVECSRPIVDSDGPVFVMRRP